MKKFIFGIIALVALVVAAYSYWEENRVYKEVKWTKHGRGVESPEDIERQKGFDYDKVNCVDCLRPHIRRLGPSAVAIHIQWSILNLCLRGRSLTPVPCSCITTISR